MAELHGYQGTVTWTAYNFWKTSVGGSQVISHVRSWDATQRVDIEDISSFDQTDGAKRKATSMYDMSGTLEGIVDSASLPALSAWQTPGTRGTANLRLVSTAGKNYNMAAAILTNINVVARKNAFVVYRCDFESDGVITEDAA